MLKKSQNNWLNGLLILALLAAIIFVGTYSYREGTYAQAVKQEIIELKAHNQQLIKRLNTLEADLAATRDAAMQWKEYTSRLAADMAEVRDWLWHAEIALDELDRIIARGKVSRPVLSVIARDIRYAIQEANKALLDEEAIRIAQSIEEQAKLRGIDPLLLTAMALVESNGRPHVRGRSGEYGLLQIMPGTGRWIAGRLGYEDWKPEDMLDPKLNIEFAAYYLAAVTKDMGGDVWTGVLAYNAGPNGARKWLKNNNGAVDKHAYVRKVQREYARLREPSGSFIVVK